MSKKIRVKIILTCITIILFATALFGAMATLWYNIQQGQHTVTITENTATLPDFKIKTKREAIHIAIQKGILKKPDYAKIDQPNWSISASKIKEKWIVSLKTRDILPSYSCVMDINDFEFPVTTSTCKWNK